MARRDVQVVREPRRIAAMASPVRVRVLAAAASAAPASVRELAVRVGMPPASLYYHVRQLVAVGLLRERGRRRAGKRWEALYEPPASDVVADPAETSPAFLRALGRVYEAVLRDATRGLTRALDDQRRAGRGRRRAAALRHRRVRLRPRDLAELRARLEGLDAFLGAADHPDGQLYDVTTVLSHQVLRQRHRPQAGRPRPPRPR